MKNNEIVPNVIYNQTCKTAEVFWEWRHKVLTRFMVAIAGIMVASGWFYKDPALRRLAFVPLLLGVVFSIVSYLLDRVNTNVLLSAYDLASQLEKKMIKEGGIFTSIHKISFTRLTHYKVLRFLYLTTASLLFITAVSIAICR